MPSDDDHHKQLLELVHGYFLTYGYTKTAQRLAKESGFEFNQEANDDLMEIYRTHATLNSVKVR